MGGSAFREEGQETDVQADEDKRQPACCAHEVREGWSGSEGLGRLEQLSLE